MSQSNSIVVPVLRIADCLEHYLDVLVVLLVGDRRLVVDGSYTQKLWMRVKRKAAYLPG